MIKIIEEVYMTVEGETESEWIIRFSVITQPGQGGYWRTPKLFNENEKAMYSVGAAHYMFVIEKDGGRGVFVMLLNDDLFENDELYNSTIDNFRNKILNDNMVPKCSCCEV